MTRSKDERLRDLIRELRGGRSQADVAGALGITQSFYSSLESGHRRITLQTLIALADFFGIARHTLMALHKMQRSDRLFAHVLGLKEDTDVRALVSGGAK